MEENTMSVSKKLATFVAAFFMLVVLCMGSLTAKAADSPKSITMYTPDGTVIAQFDSSEEYDAFMEEYSGVIPYAYTCDTTGHVHGTSTYVRAVVVNDHTVRIMTYCKWCDGFMYYTDYEY